VPSVRAVRAAAQAIPTASLVVVVFDGAAWDTDDICGDDHRLRARTAGIYTMTATLEWSANALGWRTALLCVADATNAAYDRRLAVKAAETIQAITAQYVLAAGDEVTLVVQQNSGSTLSLGGGSHVQTSLTMTWLGP
jgi:hypothetical protein